MAKDEQPQSQVISISPAELQTLMAATTVTAIKTFVEESRKLTPAQEANIQKQKEYWQILTKQGEDHKKLVQSRCTHIHNRENKSLFWRFENCYPENGWSLICCRCYKLVQNYDIDHKLINNEEFNKWWSYPALVDNG